MRDVKVTDLRNHLPAFLAKVREGEEIRVLSRGKVIARIIPEEDTAEAARKRLASLRETAQLGDLISPIDVEWDAERDPA